MINIKWSLVCHHIKIVPEHGANLIGVIENYTSPTLPLNIDQMTIVLGTIVSGETEADLEIKLLLGGQTLYRTDPGSNQITVQGDKQLTRRKNIPIHFGAIILPQFGEYTLEVSVDGLKVHTDSFRLLQKF